jgi:hypothetical protein
VAPPVTTEPAPPAEPTLRPLDIPFRQLVDGISEKDAYYFSDNYVSNETAFLQVAPQLPQAVAPGGAFIGVGPEQNFSYIALTRPDVAFVIDIRRRNMLLHLLYKAIFQEATSRSHFLALLLGREHEAQGDPGAEATIEQVLDHAVKVPKSRESFRAIHQRLMDRITKDYGFTLDLPDRSGLRQAHGEFHDKQLEIAFELHMKSARKYPTLRTLLTMRDPSGQQTSFLASEKAFRLVQKMQGENRIIPVVGDFGGDKALLGIAEFLKANKVPLATFYTSNVEEYLLQDNKWDKWIRNIDAFEIDDRSAFIRSYLARAGRTHPLQLEGHWSTTFLQRIRVPGARATEPIPSVARRGDVRADEAVRRSPQTDTVGITGGLFGTSLYVISGGALIGHTNEHTMHDKQLCSSTTGRRACPSHLRHCPPASWHTM